MFLSFLGLLYMMDCFVGEDEEIGCGNLRSSI